MSTGEEEYFVFWTWIIYFCVAGIIPCIPWNVKCVKSNYPEFNTMIKPCNAVSGYWRTHINYILATNVWLPLSMEPSTVTIVSVSLTLVPNIRHISIYDSANTVQWLNTKNPTKRELWAISWDVLYLNLKHAMAIFTCKCRHMFMMNVVTKVNRLMRIWFELIQVRMTLRLPLSILHQHRNIRLPVTNNPLFLLIPMQLFPPKHSGCKTLVGHCSHKLMYG